jgi:hypothetical protein
MELAAHGSKMSSSCVENDDVSIYKYTIASSKAAEDGEWADNLLGCKFRDVTDTHVSFIFPILYFLDLHN